jgi:MraZ protein
LVAVSGFFAGSHPQKLDSKGRISVPAEFRDILASENSPLPENKRTGLRLVYGLTQQKRLEGFSQEGFQKLLKRIQMMPDGTPAKKAAQVVYISHSQLLTLDDDGRVVLPQVMRDRLGLQLNDVALFAGNGETFEIWKEDTYTATVEAQTQAYLDAQGVDFDLRSLMPTLAEE